MDHTEISKPSHQAFSAERIKEILAADVRTAAIHEGGHYVIARALGYQAHIEIRDLTSETQDLTQYSCVSGQTFGLGFDDPPFHRSISGWGGLAAEEHANSPELDAGLLSIDVANRFELFDGVSGSDADGIFKHPQRWRTCRRACALVMEHWQEIEAIAALAHEAIVVNGRKEFIYRGTIK